VGSFYIDVTEVTVEDYTACVAAEYCLPARAQDDPACNYGRSSRGRHPINCVTWVDASMYCDWLGKRLPTEEEWDYAALRGSRLYPWGNTVPSRSLLNACGEECNPNSTSWGNDGYPTTAPVGSFPAGGTPEGLEDMGGNVWEWVHSRMCRYPSSPCTSCIGSPCPEPCADCVTTDWAIRGSAFDDATTDMSAVITTWRWWGNLGGYYGDTGFRCAR
jgi:formylglycine-generating enzyme required for sulfatase activity